MMDAFEFLKERRRMCKACENCELGDKSCCSPKTEEQMIEVITIVEKWSRKHPVKTRMSEFLKQYPNTPTKDDGLPFVSPCNLEKSFYERDCKNKNCSVCRKNYWLEEIE